MHQQLSKSADFSLTAHKVYINRVKLNYAALDNINGFRKIKMKFEQLFYMIFRIE